MQAELPSPSAVPEPSSAPSAGLLQHALVHGGSRPLAREQRRQRERSLGLSLVLQVLLAGLMLAALAIGPPVIHPYLAPETYRLLSFTPPTPPRAPYRRLALPRPALRPSPRRKPPAPPRVAVPRKLVAPVRAIVVRRLPAAAPAPLPKPPEDPVSHPEPARRPRVLSPQPGAVRLGAFGDPQGLPPQPAMPVPAPLLGAFGAATTSAPADPAPGEAITAAGFGDATPHRDADPAPSGPIRAAGFNSGIETNDANVPAPSAIAHPSGFAPAQPVTATVPPPAGDSGEEAPRILQLPTPAYTEDAARHRVEGEVVVKVRLGADGLVHILELTQRLGYGLDQSAMAAARQLRFLPARRHGQPVDWTVILHVHFRLAY